MLLMKDELNEQLQSHLANRYLYRVWDKQNHSYLTGALQLTKANEQTNYYAITSPTGKPDNYVLEQAVGYTDANQKPIFENDICTLSSTKEIIGHKYPKRQLNLGYFLVSFAPSSGSYVLYGDETEKFSQVDLNNATVVGNANENPELLSKIDLTQYYHDYPKKLSIKSFDRRLPAFKRNLDHFVALAQRKGGKGGTNRYLALLNQYQGTFYRLPDAPVAIYASEDYCTVIACVCYKDHGRGRMHYRVALSSVFSWKDIDEDFAALLKQHAITKREPQRMHIKSGSSFDQVITEMIIDKLLGIGVSMFYQSQAAYGKKYLDEQVIRQLVKRDVWNYQQRKENKTIK